jgi:tetratricopeptide (TPR) repeat protein
LGYILNIPQLLTNHNFIVQYETLRKGISQGKYKKADTDKLLEIIDSQYFGKFELRQVYAEFVPSLIAAKALSPLETKYFIDTAEAKMLKSIDEQPDNVRHHSFLLNLYLYTSTLDASYAEKAVALIENKAIPLSPTRIQLYYSLGQAYMVLGQKDQAVASFIKAKELAPKVFDSYYNLIYTYLNIGNFDAAELSLKEMHTNVPNILNDDYMRLAALYNYFGKQEEVDKIIKGL